MFLLFYCLTVPLHVHGLFPFHDFGRTKEIIYKIVVGLRNKDPLRVYQGGGGTTLYKLYRYVPPRRVGFLRGFGLKTSIHFAHFGLESGMVFEGTTGVYERIYRFNSK